MLQRESSFAKEALRYGLIVLVLGFIVFPIAWMIITSFKPADAVMVSPPRFLFTPTLENYTHAIYDKNFLFYIKNTLFISVASTVIVVVTGRSRPIVSPVTMSATAICSSSSCRPRCFRRLR
ncbi:hypothetical protein NKY46_12625 [Sinorhizobium meliloti]|uniref:hypothetical protein n=1 Tax=Rhizobium meliloti TaxID=382 RepID=UPI003D64D2AC